MIEVSAKKYDLVYLKTGNPYRLSVVDKEKVSKSDFFNNIESRVGSLHQFLLRNTDLIKFETSDHYFSGDGYVEYGYNVFALFNLNIGQNDYNRNEILGCIDLLTAAGQDIWKINYEKSKKIFNDNYLKEVLEHKLKLGIFDWLFETLKQGLDFDIVDEPFTYDEKRKNIKISEENYTLLKPNIGY